MDAEMKGYRTGINDGKERSSGPDWLRYADIIDKQHHVSKKHPPMSMEDRAAQFSPFAALTGYEAAVKETARLTDDREELDEDEKTRLNAPNITSKRAPAGSACGGCFVILLQIS